MQHPIMAPSHEGRQSAQTSLGLREDPAVNLDDAPALEILTLLEAEQTSLGSSCIRVVSI
jgi:hypothetical protein